MSDTQNSPHIQNPPSFENDEITLKELIEKLLEFWNELWHKKWWIVLIALPVAAFFGYNARKAEILYPASLTYLLNDGGGGGGAIAGILGSFGLGRGGKVNLDRIVALSKTRNIIEKVLFTEIPLDTFGGKKDFIANHLIELYRFDKEWSKYDPKLDGFRFRSSDIKSFNTTALSVLKMLYGKIVGGKGVKNPIFSNGFNEDTGILTITVSTPDEQLSIEFANLTFEELKNYYILSSTNSQKNTFEFVQSKTDSILSLLRAKEYQLAKFNDQFRNLSDPAKLSEKKMIENELFKLKNMYAEATKNYELADFSLQAGTPDIVIIDAPIPPIEPVAKSLLIELIKGGLLGGLLAVTFFLGRKIVLDALAG
ncbi:MAG: hypothetical protein IPM26_05415 [Saprospiraceae bacterium]|nr:hypothetical protein [Saprospiraceae bacterium]